MPDFTREMNSAVSITITTETGEEADQLLAPVWTELQDYLANEFANADGLQGLDAFEQLAETHPEILEHHDLLELQPSPEIVDNSYPVVTHCCRMRYFNRSFGGY